MDDVLSFERKAAFLAELLYCVRVDSEICLRTGTQSLSVTETPSSTYMAEHSKQTGMEVVIVDMENDLRATSYELTKKRNNLQKQLRNVRLTKARQPLTMIFEIGSIVWSLRAAAGTFMSGQLTKMFVGTVRSEVS